MAVAEEKATLQRTKGVLLSCEVPTKFLPKFDRYLDYHFTLAHLILEDEGYCDFYSKSKKFKILDNSAFELGVPISNKKLFDAYNRISPSELVLRDSMANGSITIQRSQETLEYFTKRDADVQFMGVAQGADFKDWVRCVRWLHSNPQVNTIGVNGWPSSINAFKNKIDSEDATECRIEALKFMQKEGYTEKPVHLLGMGNNPIEARVIKKFKFVRSVDTSSPILHGIYTVKFDKTHGLWGPKIRTKLPFDLAKLNPVQLEAIEHNLKMLKAWAI